MKTAQAKTSAPRQPGESSNILANQVFRLALFDHLPRKQTPKDPDSIEEDRYLHPATVHLGLMYNKGQIQSDDDRVQALIIAFLTIIKDYKTPPKKILREDLDRYISKQVQHIVDCRQISKSMGNVIKFVRTCISSISPTLNESDAKASLIAKLEAFYEEKVLYASENIAKYVTSTIMPNDVILTFGSSPLIRKVLLHVASQKTFKLIVIDTRPLHEGMETLAALSELIPCIYAPLSGTATILKDVNKVILGASCLLSNGSMLAPAGTAMVAALAKSRHIPVIVASESYKFSDKVQLDSIVFNELGHPSELVKVSVGNAAAAAATTAASSSSAAGGSANDLMIGGYGGLQNVDGTGYTLTVTDPSNSSIAYTISPQLDQAGYRGSADKLAITGSTTTSNPIDNIGIDNAEYVTIPAPPSQTSVAGVKLPFDVVNLRYDLTPLSNISVIATETGLIPPTSIPVLIREIQTDQQAK